MEGTSGGKHTILGLEWERGESKIIKTKHEQNFEQKGGVYTDSQCPRWVSVVMEGYKQYQDTGPQGVKNLKSRYSID